MNEFQLWDGWEFEDTKSFCIKLYLLLFKPDQFNEKGLLEHSYGRKIIWENDLGYVFDDGCIANKLYPTVWEVYENYNFNGWLHDKLERERNEISYPLYDKNYGTNLSERLIR